MGRGRWAFCMVVALPVPRVVICPGSLSVLLARDLLPVHADTAPSASNSVSSNIPACARQSPVGSCDMACL